MNTSNYSKEEQSGKKSKFTHLFKNTFQIISKIFIFLVNSKKLFFSWIRKIIFKALPFLEKRKWYAFITRKFLKYSFNLILFILLFFIVVDINFLWLFGASPRVSKDKNADMYISSELYTADGMLIGKYYKENRSPVEFKEISKNVINAAVATEDERFFDHSGIDFRAVFSVFYYMYKGDNRGGSTITQQLAKNLYKTRRSSKGLLGWIPGFRTIIAKTKEWITALKLESRYSKEDILTMYLNTVDFGSNSYGIKIASLTYFNKQPYQLNIQESAMLIGMLKAPTTFSPILNPEKCLERRNVVLNQMLKNNYLNRLQFDSITKLPITLDYSVENPEDGMLAPYIRKEAANEVKSWCKENGYDIYRDGLKIYTSIDSKLQKYAEEAVSDHMKTLQKRFNNHWQNENPWVDDNEREIPDFIEDYARTTSLYKGLMKKFNNDTSKVNKVLNAPRKMRVFTWKKNGEKDTTLSPMDSIRYYKKFLNAGFMVMNPYTGKILAWVGGINHKYFKYDHVKQAKRQPGSTFKPFVYCAAIDKGWSPCDRITDQQVTINYVENGEKKSWSPHNADWEFSGKNMTLRYAMARSCNSVTVQLSEKIGFATVAEYAKKLGISTTLKPVPSIGLGSNDVSLYEMIAAYSTFLNKGIYTKPMLVTKIYDRNGKLLHEFKPERKRVLNEKTAFLMVHMLRGGLEEPGGTSQALWDYPEIFEDKNEIGGKTGTSSNYSDGWFMGVTKDIVAGSWVGGDDRCIHFRKELKAEGCRTALPIYGIFMTKVYNDPSTRILRGKFPEPTLKMKEYYCPTAWEHKNDSLDEESEEIDENTLNKAVGNSDKISDKKDSKDSKSQKKKKSDKSDATKEENKNDWASPPSGDDQ